MKVFLVLDIKDKTIPVFEIGGIFTTKEKAIERCFN